MAKRKTKNEIEITSNEQQNNDNKELIENNNVNKESKEFKENTDNKTTKKKNDKTEYIITKKTEGVYIRKLRRL